MAIQLQQAIDYSKANPTSDYAKQIGTAIKSGAFDSVAQTQGVDLTPYGRMKPMAAPAPAATPSPKLGSDALGVGNYAANAIKEQASSGVGQMKQGYSEAATATNPLQKTEAGMKMLAGGIGAVTAPLAPALKPIGDIVSWLGEKIGSTQAAQDFVTNHPDAANALSRIATDVGTTSTVLGTAMGGPEALTKAPEVSAAVKGATTDVIGAAKAGTQAVTSTAKAISEKVVPTPTIDSLVGKVAQGKPEDIPSFSKGLSSLDTSNIKTYADLKKTAETKVGTLVKQQDALLAKDTTNYKVQQLATPIKTGETVTRHNYVLDSMEQLRQYYTKTNDVAKLAKINAYEAKLDPTKGTGLQLKDINDISRMHGSDLNAYNANGELASGLTRQAAENTRQGLKTTVRNLMPDDASRALDKQISDLYTVKGLSSDMAEKVNTLQQRLQSPNILQKIGGAIGQGLRVTGIGDLASKLLGIDKVPGASTLSAIEIESRLSKNLKAIDKAMAKDDKGFVEDITKILQDPVNHSAVQPSSESPNTQSINVPMRDSVPPATSNVNRGFVKLGPSPEEPLNPKYNSMTFKSAVTDNVSKQLADYVHEAPAKGKEVDFEGTMRLYELKDILDKRALTQKEVAEAVGLLRKQGIETIPS